MFEKNDVWVCSMSNVTYLVKALLGSMFDVSSFKAKNWVFKFEFVWCSKNDVGVRSIFDKMVFDTF